MARRMAATSGKVQGVLRSLAGVSVGRESYGLVGSTFADSAQTHLDTTRDNLDKGATAVDAAHAKTAQAAKTYRETEHRNTERFTSTNQRLAKSGIRGEVVSDVDRRADQPNAETRIGDRLNANSPKVSRHILSEVEQSLHERSKQVVQVRELKPGEHVNEAFDVTFSDGSHGVYKPIAGADASIRESIPADGMAAREVAVSRLDEKLGFGLVPTTAFADGHRGLGSVQQWQDSTDGRPPEDYPRYQQEQVAVLDYITANTDRHPGNNLTSPEGNFVAIDHGYCFPETAADKLRSSYVAHNLNVPLSEELLAKVRSIDLGEVADLLAATGLRGSAASDGIARLGEIQESGMITGDAWPGVITDAYWRTVRGAK
ncbi:hypothetical protein [Herbihabitans rhizosphaerae]|uniref:hypothetical protein n=1 Tax=Herbihabitans rhizosphaerae TaxID=1872711 RepID=UPI00102B87C2